MASKSLLAAWVIRDPEKGDYPVTLLDTGGRPVVLVSYDEQRLLALQDVVTALAAELRLPIAFVRFSRQEVVVVVGGADGT